MEPEETTMHEPYEPCFEGPAVVELMGHRRLMGTVSDVPGFGGRVLRLVIPLPDGRSAQQFYGYASIFCVTQLDEETITSDQVRKHNQVTLSRLELLTVEEQAHFEERTKREHKEYMDRWSHREQFDPVDIDLDDDLDANAEAAAIESQGEEFDAGWCPAKLAPLPIMDTNAGELQATFHRGGMVEEPEGLGRDADNNRLQIAE